ncbi:GNAT family N-acetyltransferase [Lacibacter sp. H375]|uniref:GNAT family N-acetyltransferase n=1 Tax=Lacibacter sp. H375 TaxID=3133424 RepID=UPI0030C42E99
MTVFTKQNKPVILKQLTGDDLDQLLTYLNQLSPATVKRFQPHSFHKEDVVIFYNNQEHEAWIAFDPASETIIAYTVLKKGYLHHDYPRLQQYGVEISYDHCYTIAPSVTDEWQSTGVGQLLFNYVIDEMKNRKVKQLILWGGVQTDNFKAVRFYQKNGFRSLGHFQYNGLNEDMLLTL